MIQQATCPVCGKPIESLASGPGALPFCSDRCRKIDFFRWWDGKYAVVEDLSQEGLQMKLLEDQPSAETLDDDDAG